MICFKGGAFLYWDTEYIDEIKRKLRSLKKLEIKIRFGYSFFGENSAKIPPKANLVWNEFFDIRNTSCYRRYENSGYKKCKNTHGKQSSNNDKANKEGHLKARYSLGDIASKSKEEFREIVNEFFYNVYYKYYIENGIISSSLYDPEILKWMGLPPDAGAEDIKKRFRELAKKYHPDTGGDSKMFIELIENYKKLNLT